RHLLDPLVGREPTFACEALAPATDGAAFVGEARVDDLVVEARAPGAAHGGETTAGASGGRDPGPAAVVGAGSGVGRIAPAGEPCPFGAAERLRRLLGVVRVLGERVDRPRAPRRAEEVAPVHVDRRGERVLARVGDRVDDVGAEQEDVLLAELPSTRRDDRVGFAAIEGVVLLAVVDADRGPHAV